VYGFNGMESELEPPYGQAGWRQNFYSLLNDLVCMLVYRMHTWLSCVCNKFSMQQSVNFEKIISEWFTDINFVDNQLMIT